MSVKRISATVTDGGKTKIISTYTASPDERWGKHERLTGAVKDRQTYVDFADLPPEVRKVLMHTKEDIIIQWTEENEDGGYDRCEAIWSPNWIEVKDN